MPLTMYTTTWCGFCKNLKRQLGRAGIEVTEVDIELDPAAAEFVIASTAATRPSPRSCSLTAPRCATRPPPRCRRSLRQLASATAS